MTVVRAHGHAPQCVTLVYPKRTGRRSDPVPPPFAAGVAVHKRLAGDAAGSAFASREEKQCPVTSTCGWKLITIRCLRGLPHRLSSHRAAGSLVYPIHG